MRKITPLIICFIFYITTVSLYAQEDLKTGFKHSTKDKLEILKPFEESTFKGELKSAIDLSYNFPPVGDQGDQNSCVAWAISNVLSFYNHSSYNSYYTSSGEIDCSTVFSPSFIYNPINNCTNMPITFPEGLDFVKANGIVDQCEMPYLKNDYCTMPSQKQYDKAYSYRITEYYVAYAEITTKMLKEKLNEGYPILIGVDIDKSFILTFYKKVSNYVWDAYYDNNSYGHAMILVGYNDNLGAFKVMNSWSTNWGDQGYIWLSYNFAPICIKEAYYIEK